MGMLSDEEKTGHEVFESDEQMYATYQAYCKREIGLATLVKVAWFRLVK